MSDHATDPETGIAMRFVQQFDIEKALTVDAADIRMWAACIALVKSQQERQAHIDAATAAGLSLSDYLRERGLT